MRLIETSTFELSEFIGSHIPFYAILSHRLRGCCAQAAKDGFQWVWIDSCCIDKSSSAELSEAINSMFKWYEGAQVCYAYLYDVTSSIDNLSNVYAEFRRSEWFTRGWTLQELLAPQCVEFYNRDWVEIGTKSSLAEMIKKITGINRLFNYELACVAQKMSWMARRETTREEDIAYCLMGLFGVNMPTLYGEGSKAFLRLQQEILSKSEDESIFAWEGPLGEFHESGLLAHSPKWFGDCAHRRRVLETNLNLLAD
ncbi:HET-domain-containing protein [Mollisia scopiformis]|uniref:HET-domain-containing protein n=1 Tax=Mollisia scopiformis TaxID=149040 RepID=A0A194XF27_MOLSC|nr:HET-domain-containing protein [Mollisia scopiformis]KUJ18739.1 HET-domain-containing protein [Mollisia scopiformis]